MTRLHVRLSAAAVLLTLGALAAAPPAQARKVYEGITISEATFEARCKAAGGSFSDLGDGRVACKIHGIVIVCLMALNRCDTNEVSGRISRLPKGLLGSRPLPLGSGDGSPSSSSGSMNDGGGMGDGGPQVK
jgi:hypothetical protein